MSVKGILVLAPAADGVAGARCSPADNGPLQSSTAAYQRKRAPAVVLSDPRRGRLELCVALLVRYGSAKGVMRRNKRTSGSGPRRRLTKVRWPP